MVKFAIFAGGYSSFIVSYLFDTQTYDLQYLQTISTSEDPSWLIPHPTNEAIIYAVNEVTPGVLQSYARSPGGGLTLLDQVSSGGSGPAFCAPLSTGQVVILNYGSGDGEVVPTVHGGSHFDNSTSVLVTFTPPPGGVSNPHMAVEHENEVFVADLGGDKLWRMGQVGAAGDFGIHGLTQHPKGTGPRHFAIADNYIYVLHETANTLIKQSVPSYPNGTSPILYNVSTLASDAPPNATFAAAEILLPPPTPLFPTSYIYASNRNIGNTTDPRGDTIGIFEPETLGVVKQVYTGLVQIRGMELGVGEEGQEYLVALGAVSGGMVVYRRTEGGRALVEVARNSSAVARSSLVMLKS
ncbi:Lactonase, 7-bladed beta-propeller-domain-containing protein [Roridomyces roridus]|uniref:Lactonase, 7-bladed beta-propeller-domain-containing protein n=1 Tax=Roridomyces roridus TaxID=1738132 RepID=A0AAD7BDM4_9AGAR|nr:Lactonase, 7-bladed beta-propeller-domain-containing protein [Roridomyces roridus]